MAFSHGTVVEKLIEMAIENKAMIVADSQSSSQLGDVSRFKDADLLLPTEREAVSTQNRGWPCSARRATSSKIKC